MNREAVEDFFYHEAALLDAWDLDGWMDLLCDDARYLVPPNDVPDGDPDNTLFIIADDIDRIRGRVKRLKRAASMLGAISTRCASRAALFGLPSAAPSSMLRNWAVSVP